MASRPHASVLSRLFCEVKVQAVAIGDAGDVERYIAAGFTAIPGVRVLPPLRDIRLLFALCARAVAYFGNDTGPAHVCAAAGRPAVVLMSGRAPKGSGTPMCSVGW